MSSNESEQQNGKQKLSDGQKRRLRRLLLWGGPIVVAIVAAVFYITGGRYVSTENAYIKADKVTVSAQVSGPIDLVAVKENQPVQKGDLLFRIDQRPYKLALNRAEAKLGNVRDNLQSLKAQYRQTQEQLDLGQTRLHYAQRQLKRQQSLADRNMASQSDLDDAKFKVDEARQQIQVTKQQLQQLRAQLGGDPDTSIEQLPQYKEAQSALDQAKLDLQHTEVTAPFDGIASQTPEPGRFVSPGSPVMAVVGAHHVWITANFKETEITKMKAGQPVTISVDTYPGHTWHGHVQSIAQASGAEFSVLPPQNATGNWVKVVQRIPVRIAVDDADQGPQLRAGMSTEVEVDTGHYRMMSGLLSSISAWFHGSDTSNNTREG